MTAMIRYGAGSSHQASKLENTPPVPLRLTATQQQTSNGATNSADNAED